MTTDVAMPTYNISGSKPATLITHVVAKEYNIAGITTTEFLDRHTGVDFNLVELRAAFKKHCDDYMTDLLMDVKSKAVDFCSKIIYEIGPESRKVKKGTGDKVWKFIFKTDDHKEHFVFVATYKQESAEFKPENTANTMILSLKQAALLVHETLARLVKFGHTVNKTLLTPLAGACFCKEDLDDMAKKLNIDKCQMIIIVNQSTQGGGHYLSKSDVDVAICASYAAIRNVKDENLKRSIVVKMIKQYINQGKVPDKERIRIISMYATGGVPSEFSYESISELIHTEQKTYAMLKLKKMEVESQIKSIIDVPGTAL